MKIKFKLTVFILILLFNFSPVLNIPTANAQFQSGFVNEYENYLKEAAIKGTYDPAQASDSFIDTRLGEIIGYAMGFIGLAFFILIIASGFQWMTAGGNEESVTSAKKRVINGTIGLIITLAAFIITNFVYKFFDEKFLKTPPNNQLEETPPAPQNDQDCSEVDPAKPKFYNGTCVECTENADCGKWWNPGAWCNGDHECI